METPGFADRPHSRGAFVERSGDNCSCAVKLWPERIRLPPRLCSRRPLRHGPRHVLAPPARPSYRYPRQRLIKMSQSPRHRARSPECATVTQRPQPCDSLACRALANSHARNTFAHETRCSGGATGRVLRRPQQGRGATIRHGICPIVRNPDRNGGVERVPRDGTSTGSVPLRHTCCGREFSRRRCGRRSLRAGGRACGGAGPGAWRHGSGCRRPGRGHRVCVRVRVRRE
jgi:hypothetical protein